jgi:mannosyltransferase OCH1-like enzyme
MTPGRSPIVQYWHSEELPAEIEELAATFQERNPSLRHRIFAEAEAEAFISRHFSAREVAAFRACAVPAMQADFFRYCAIFILGGVYSDVDFRCLRSLEPLIEATEGGQLFRVPSTTVNMDGSINTDGIINGFFLFEKPGHPLLRLTIDIATMNIERRATRKIWKLTGPLIFTGLSTLSQRPGASNAARGDQPQRIDRPVLDAVDADARVAHAFENVSIAPFETLGRWVEEVGASLSHKQSQTDWLNWYKRGGPTFR